MHGFHNRTQLTLELSSFSLITTLNTWDGVQGTLDLRSPVRDQWKTFGSDPAEIIYN